jgi:RNA polymerase sigma-70 factor (ECF subfamily)
VRVDELSRAGGSRYKSRRQGRPASPATLVTVGRVEHALSADEARLVEGLRRGDQSAFAELMREYGAAMLRVAQMYVSTRAVAEEVVQDAWIGVFNGIGRFEGRSSLKTWIFRILANTAKTRGAREARSVPFSSLGGTDDAVDPDRFLGAEERFPGHWASPPASWAGGPEGRLLGREALDVIEGEIERLPPTQAAVITMRDVEGFSPEEVCNALEISETNQRVLLHRARSKVRRALEEYMR